MDYLSTCRLCLHELHMDPVVDKCKNFTPIDCRAKLLISFCLDIKVNNIEHLSYNICEGCKDKIYEFNKFKKKCKIVEEILNEYLTTIKYEEVIKEDDDENDLEYEITRSSDTSLLIHKVTKSSGDEAEGEEDVEQIEETEKENSEDEEEKRKLEESQAKERELKTRLISECNSNVCLVTLKRLEDTPYSYILENLKRSYAGNIVKQMIQSKKYECGYCGETFSRQVTLEAHVTKHEMEIERLFKCVLCFETFHTHNQLLKHKVDIHNEDPYYCSFCALSSSDVYEWTNHMNAEHVGCMKCHSYFKDPESLESHDCKGCNDTEFDINRIVYKCPDSISKSRSKYKKIPKRARGRPLSEKGRIRQLKKILASANKNKEESTPATLEEKIKIAEAVKKLNLFSCIHCFKFFNSKDSLICHQAVNHSGMFMCKHCLTLFDAQNQLNGHTCPFERFSYNDSPLNKQKIKDEGVKEESHASTEGLNTTMELPNGEVTSSTEVIPELPIFSEMSADLSFNLSASLHEFLTNPPTSSVEDLNPSSSTSMFSLNPLALPASTSTATSYSASLFELNPSYSVPATTITSTPYSTSMLELNPLASLTAASSAPASTTVTNAVINPLPSIGDIISNLTESIPGLSAELTKIKSPPNIISKPKAPNSSPPISIPGVSYVYPKSTLTVNSVERINSNITVTSSSTPPAPKLNLPPGISIEKKSSNSPTLNRSAMQTNSSPTPIHINDTFKLNLPPGITINKNRATKTPPILIKPDPDAPSTSARPVLNIPQPPAKIPKMTSQPKNMPSVKPRHPLPQAPQPSQSDNPFSLSNLLSQQSKPQPTFQQPILNPNLSDRNQASMFSSWEAPQQSFFPTKMDPPSIPFPTHLRQEQTMQEKERSIPFPPHMVFSSTLNNLNQPYSNLDRSLADKIALHNQLRYQSNERQFNMNSSYQIMQEKQRLQTHNSAFQTINENRILQDHIRQQQQQQQQQQQILERNRMEQQIMNERKRQEQMLNERKRQEQILNERKRQEQQHILNERKRQEQMLNERKKLEHQQMIERKRQEQQHILNERKKIEQQMLNERNRIEQQQHLLNERNRLEQQMSYFTNPNPHFSMSELHRQANHNAISRSMTLPTYSSNHVSSHSNQQVWVKSEPMDHYLPQEPSQSFIKREPGELIEDEDMPMIPRINVKREPGELIEDNNVDFNMVSPNILETFGIRQDTSL